MKLIVPPLEKDEQKVIVDMYEICGFWALTTSQPQRAMMTAGWPDLLLIDRRDPGLSFWHEVKRQHGPEFQKVAYGVTGVQIAMHQMLRWAGHEVIVGARDQAEIKLRVLGRIR